MVYSTSRCPHCKNVVKQETNPVHEVANPFERCMYCGNYYKNSYKEEWITKSPFKRFMFFVQGGVWARAFIFPLIIAGILMGTTGSSGAMFGTWIVGFIAWMISGYFIHKNAQQGNIAESIKRTEVIEYVELLKKAGYTIYEIEGVKHSIRHEYEETLHEDIVEDIVEIQEEKKTERQEEDIAKKYYDLAEALLDQDKVEDAIENYIKSSEMNYDEADISLGYIYLNGRGVRKNKTKARFYFERAKLKGNEYAEKILKDMDEEKAKCQELRKKR